MRKQMALKSLAQIRIERKTQHKKNKQLYLFKIRVGSIINFCGNLHVIISFGPLIKDVPNYCNTFILNHQQKNTLYLSYISDEDIVYY